MKTVVALKTVDFSKLYFQIDAEMEDLIEEADGERITGVDCTIFEDEKMIAGFFMHPCGFCDIHAYKGYEHLQEELEKHMETMVEEDSELANFVEEMDDYNGENGF